MKNFLSVSVVLIAACLWQSPVLHAEPSAEVWPLRLGVQAWTYRDKTFVETLQEVEKLGVTHLQAYRGQRLGEGFGKDERFTHQMPAATREKVLELARAHGIRITSYGVVTGGNEEDWRSIFRFASVMGMEDIAIEPKEEVWPQTLPLLLALSEESKVKFGFHNHPNPVPPAEFLRRLDAHAPGLKLYADTGHWARSGWDPVESLRLAQGRLLGLHFKDLTQRSRNNSHDVPWGTGSSDAAGQLAELRRQKFGGVIYLEYEHRTPQLPEEVALSVAYFNRAQKSSDAELIANSVLPPQYVRENEVAQIMPAAAAGMWPEPQPLFAGVFEQPALAAGTAWMAVDGVLALNVFPENLPADWQSSVLLAPGEYKDYSVGLEFMCEPGARAALLLNVVDGAADAALKIAIAQGVQGEPREATGALMGVAEPLRLIDVEAERWYRLVVSFRSNGRLVVRLDGEPLLDIRLGEWKEAGRNPDGSANAYSEPLARQPRAGAVGLEQFPLRQGTPIRNRAMSVEHGIVRTYPPMGVRFRNLTIEPL